MSDVEDRLRLLAHWHARRREVDELLEPLLAHGPAAVERVTARLPELAQALEAERWAFEAFAGAEQPAPRVMTMVDPADEVAVARAARARPPRPAVHPSVAEVVAQLDLDGPVSPLHVLAPPAPREDDDGPGA